LSDLWFSIVPDPIVKMLPALSLVIIGYLVEKQFVGRISTFANTLAINLYAILLVNPATWFVWYANIGFLMGIVGLVAYGGGTSLSQIYYKISWAYCSIVVGLLILLVH